MINRVVLVGRMTRDPELRMTNKGDPVTSFTLAVNRIGSEDTDFINCVVWNKIAENVEKYCSKGSLVGVDGNLRSRSYDNAQGQKVYVVEVLCHTIQFLDTKSTRESQQQYSQPQQAHDVDLDKEFDNSLSSFDIIEEDIQF